MDVATNTCPNSDTFSSCAYALRCNRVHDHRFATRQLCGQPAELVLVETLVSECGAKLSHNIAGLPAIARHLLATDVSQGSPEGQHPVTSCCSLRVYDDAANATRAAKYISPCLPPPAPPRSQPVAWTPCLLESQPDILAAWTKG